MSLKKCTNFVFASQRSFVHESGSGIDSPVEQIIDDSIREVFCLSVLEIAGAHFRGIMRGDGQSIPWLCLFDGPDNSTLEIPLDDLSVETVRAKLAESIERFAQARARNTKAEGALP